MIVRILSRGQSFKGLAAYLTHDAEAETDERVAWTHTHNLANDNVLSAVDEMLWTARDAELLKMEAGIRAGGRATENPVKHLSLNWAPGEEPTKEHMIKTTEAFLEHMGWADHQALMVGHQDKEYRHVHVMLNAVHPETGLKLDDNFEYRRAQSWALEYEREHGLHCENRLKDERERQESPTRPAWMAFKGAEKQFVEAEKSLEAETAHPEIKSEKSTDIHGEEWAALKSLQREERTGFFAEGKLAFKEMRNEIFREVREEFRGRWSEYYDWQHDGLPEDALKEMKAAIVADQAAVLAERRDAACKELRETRDGLYKELLSGQQEMRDIRRGRQRAGFESLDLIDDFRVDRSRYTIERPVTEQREPDPINAREESRARSATSSEHSAGMRSGAHIAGGIGDGAFAMVGGLFDWLAGGDNGKSYWVDAEPVRSGPTPRETADDDAARRAAQDAEADERRRRSDDYARSQQ
jgi:hypothetical protein